MTLVEITDEPTRRVRSDRREKQLFPLSELCSSRNLREAREALVVVSKRQ